MVWQVCIEPAGQRFAAPAHATVLASALAAGVSMPSSCRNGTCRACRCRLIEGHVDYRVEWPGLSAEEKAEGWTLPCVALPRANLRLLPLQATLP